MASQSRTKAATATYTYTLSNVHTVTEAVCEDLEELVKQCNINLGVSMGAAGASLSSNDRLLRNLQNDLYRLLYKGLVTEIAFVCHDAEKFGTGDGYLMNYMASYMVRPGERQGPGSGRIAHQPLARAMGNCNGVFKIIVVWSNTFFGLSNGERQSLMNGEDGWNFEWAPAPQLLDDLMEPGTITGHYYSGQYGVARVERVRVR